MVWHLARMIGITAVITLAIIYPFLPGRYDRVALPLSTMAQLLGMLALLLVPIGIFWLLYEFWLRSRGNLGQQTWRYSFALVATVVASLVVTVVAAVAFAVAGYGLALLTAVIWLYTLFRLRPRLKLLKQADSRSFSAIPLYLIVIPALIAFAQLRLAAPLTEFSRNQAIANSTRLINDIEGYYNRQGHYPVSLTAVWQDYAPAVVGIQDYHYAPAGAAYNLSFEQPRFLFDNIGTREFVVYNKLNQHTIISHDGWILLLSPSQLATSQGWYATHQAASQHWRYFWFD